MSKSMVMPGKIRRSKTMGPIKDDF